MTEKIVDNLTDYEGKVHITTTISIDKAALHTMSRESVPSGLAGVPHVQRFPGHQKITMLRVGANTYLGLVDGRSSPRPLCIGDTLFLFVPRDQPILGLAKLVADMTRQLPQDVPWRGHDDWTKLDLAQLAEILSSSDTSPVR